MVASWVRRSFDGAVGVTQYRPGRHLAAVQEHFLGGRALLCIDVSWSMEGERLRSAVAGGLDFLDEAIEARYRCGLVLWHAGIDVHLRTGTDPDKLRRRLKAASPGDGTALAPTVRAARKELGPLPGDRVVCIFSDGQIPDLAAAEREARKAREVGIRFVVRGLGPEASRSLARALGVEEAEADHTIRHERDVRRGIASMVADLRRP
jgi:Mg-chelatase subunit ChlD